MVVTAKSFVFLIRNERGSGGAESLETVKKYRPRRWDKDNPLLTTWRTWSFPNSMKPNTPHSWKQLPGCAACVAGSQWPLQGLWHGAPTAYPRGQPVPPGEAPGGPMLRDEGQWTILLYGLTSHSGPLRNPKAINAGISGTFLEVAGGGKWNRAGWYPDSVRHLWEAF